MKRYLLIGTILLVACNGTTRMNKKTTKPPCEECPSPNKKYQGKMGGR